MKIEECKIGMIIREKCVHERGNFSITDINIPRQIITIVSCKKPNSPYFVSASGPHTLVDLGDFEPVPKKVKLDKEPGEPATKGLVMGTETLPGIAPLKRPSSETHPTIRDVLYAVLAKLESYREVDYTVLQCTGDGRYSNYQEILFTTLDPWHVIHQSDDCPFLLVAQLMKKMGYEMPDNI